MNDSKDLAAQTIRLALVERSLTWADVANAIDAPLVWTVAACLASIR